tara:strand:- start:28783 stop:29373 length:591 start_codon:yes stop_codon:yes gene_type:complete
MKKSITIVLIILVMSIASAFATVHLTSPIPATPLKITNNPINLSPSILEIKSPLPIIKGHNTFLNDIGFRESSNNYKAVNQYGYLGKYQFGRKTLNAIGFKAVSNREFLSSPSIQEEAMIILLKKNKRTLRREIKKYSGKTVNGIYITESGLLAAAHLGGAGNVRKFFRKGKNFTDGNGTPITSYMELFANYKIKI